MRFPQKAAELGVICTDPHLLEGTPLPTDPIDIVFVHGVLSDGGAWETLIRFLRQDPELGGIVRCHVFKYNSPLLRLRPDRRIPGIDDIAGRLDTLLTTGELANAKKVAIVTHSQGGLVAQRFLVRMLRESRGLELARIRLVAMYACPNAGSQFLLSSRRRIMRRSNPQEVQLRPSDPAVTETQQAFLRDVVNVHASNANQCRIPVALYAGSEDQIVPAQAAISVFPRGKIVSGDHFSIIRPVNPTMDSYLALKQDLLNAAKGESVTTAEMEEAAERQARVSVSPPLGRREGRLYGRDGIIRSIASETKTRVRVLAGLGGSGKSRIALELAERAMDAGHKVWWIKVPRINGCMRELAYQLGIPESQIELAWKSGSPADLIWPVLNALTSPWLLIFDNADEPAHLATDDPVSDATGWLRSPKGGVGEVIVTTRDANAQTWGNWCTLYQVRPLESSDGAAMLMELAGLGAGTREQARALSTRLGGLPLALSAAAAYLRSARDPGRVYDGGGDVTDFASYEETVRKRFGLAAGVAPAANVSETLGLEIVQEVFGLSLDLLARRGFKEATPLLKLLACLGTEPVPYYRLLAEDVLNGSVIMPYFTADTRRQLLAGLADLGLVELEHVPGIDDPDLSNVLSLHPVVHGTFRGDEDVRQRRAAYYGLIVDLLLAAVKDHDPDYPGGWGVWHALVQHTDQVCRAVLLGSDPLGDQRVIAQALELARRTCRYLIVAGITEPAENLVVRIIENAARLGYHQDDREILALRHEKGRIAIERGDYAGAVTQLQEVVGGRSQVLGNMHYDTLASRHKLAKAMLGQCRWEKAEAELTSIVQDERNVRGYDHPDTIVVRHSLARAIYAQGRHKEAEAMLREIRAVQLLEWARDTPETLSVQLTLARCLLDQDRAVEAQDEVREALGLIGRREVLVVLELQYRFVQATVLLELGDRNMAIAELRTLLADRQKMLGVAHPDTHLTQQFLDEVLQHEPLR